MYTPDNAVRYELTLCEQSPLGEAVVDLAEQTKTPLANPEVISGLQEIRDQLESLNNSDHPDDKAAWESIKNNFLGLDADYMPLSLWTYDLQENVGRQIILAPDSELLEILKWNVARQREHQQRLNQDVRQLKEQALADVDQLIGYGLLPLRTRQLAQMAVMRSKVFALDSFESGLRMCAGYYYIFGEVLGMANHYRGGPTGFADATLQSQNTFTHEAGHAIEIFGEGGLRTIDPSDSDIDELPYTWFNEMFIEHCSQVARHGEPNTFMPENRTVDNGSHNADRTLGHLVLFAGERRIDPDLLGDAFVESMEDSVLHARKKLGQELRASFQNVLEVPAPHIVQAIALECAYIPVVKANEVITKWIERITDATGYVSQ